MSDTNGRVETAEEFAKYIGKITPEGWDTTAHHYIKARDAAIRAAQRKETAGEVLDRVSFKIHSEYTYTGADVLQALGDLRREYAQEAKMDTKCPHTLLTFHSDPSGGNDSGYTCNHCGADVPNPPAAAEPSAHDAAVARAARVGVLREVLSMYLPGDTGITGEVLRQMMTTAVAARHGITPAELEPEKEYRIERVDVQGRNYYRVSSGGKWWASGEWSACTFMAYDSRNEAERAIADLRADKNFPKEPKR